MVSRPFLSSLEHRLECWLGESDLPHRLAVGFSGGADSTALLLALAQRGHQVVAWHVDHGWSRASTDVADSLERKCEAWGIEFHRVRLSVPSGKNREAEARKGRFAQFSTWASCQNINTLCLAHHRNDQAETVCMRLLQGAGVCGCGGMRRVRESNRLRVVRPLLHVARDEIVEVLRDAGLNWYEDISNNDTTLLRNRIRKRLFPAMQTAGIEPVHLFLRWQAQAVKLQQDLNKIADVVDIKKKNEDAVVHWKAWHDCSVPVRAVILQRMNAQLFGAGAVLGRRHIELAEAWRRHGGRAGIDLSRCRLFRDRETLHLAPVSVNLPR